LNSTGRSSGRESAHFHPPSIQFEPTHVGCYLEACECGRVSPVGRVTPCAPAWWSHLRWLAIAASRGLPALSRLKRPARNCGRFYFG